MITKLIWPKCHLMDYKNAFWVGCRDDEVTEQILPVLKSNKADEEIRKISLNRGQSKIEEDRDEEFIYNYFLISADGKEILSFDWVLPYAGQWNASNPFRIIGKELIANLNDLIILEDRLNNEGRLNIEQDEKF